MKTSKPLRSNPGSADSAYRRLRRNNPVSWPTAMRNMLVELDRTGKEVWSLFCDQYPASATRLPNGNTLVAFLSTRRIAEYDRNGREVWSQQLDGPVYSARKR